MKILLFALYVGLTPLFVIEGAIIQPINAWRQYAAQMRAIEALEKTTKDLHKFAGKTPTAAADKAEAPASP